MTIDIPQETLDALTRVKLPGGVRIRKADDTVEIKGLQMPRSQSLRHRKRSAGIAR
jgi:hypothetical protein